MSNEDIEKKIISALENTKFKARTINGIAKESKISEYKVKNEIIKNKKLQELIKIYPRISQQGDVLITTKKRFSVEATTKDKLIDFFSSPIKKEYLK
jgi:alpha-galactosidase